MSPFQKLKNEQLSAVTFVQDYLQLHFDGPTFNVFTPLYIEEGAGRVTPESAEFRNALCAQISKIVSIIEIKDNEYFRIGFSDQSNISISLVPSDYTGPEAIYFHGYDETVVI